MTDPANGALAEATEGQMKCNYLSDLEMDRIAWDHAGSNRRKQTKPIRVADKEDSHADDTAVIGSNSSNTVESEEPLCPKDTNSPAESAPSQSNATCDQRMEYNASHFSQSRTQSPTLANPDNHDPPKMCNGERDRLSSPIANHPKQFHQTTVPMPATPVSTVTTPTTTPQTVGPVFRDEDYCDMCQKHFCNKYYLRKHKADVHGVLSEPLSTSRRKEFTFPSQPSTGLPVVPFGLPPPPTSQSQHPGHPIHPMYLPPHHLVNPLAASFMFFNPFAAASGSPMALIAAAAAGGAGNPGSQQGPPPLPPPFLPIPPPNVLFGSPAPAPQMGPSLPLLNRQESSSSETYCDICQKDVCNKYFLRIHKANKHGVKMDIPNSSANFYQDSGSKGEKMEEYPGEPENLTLPKSSSDSKNEISHCEERLHEAPKSEDQELMCSLCGRDFPNKYNLTLHVYNVHSKQAFIGGHISHDNNNTVLPMDGIETSAGSGPNPNQPNVSPSMDAFRSSMVAAKLADRVTCEICRKDLCNKYFLRTHRIKVHGILPREAGSPPPTGCRLSDEDSFDSNQPTPSAVPTEAIPSPHKVNEADCYCELCQKMVSPKAFYMNHMIGVHGIAKHDPGVNMRMSPPATVPGLTSSTGHGQQQYQQQLSPTEQPYGSDRPLNVPPPSAFMQVKFSPGEPPKPTTNGPPDSSITSTSSSSLTKWSRKSPNQMRVLCDICDKWICNKYFLRTHKANKHGIGEVSSKPCSLQGGGGAGRGPGSSGTESLIHNRQGSDWLSAPSASSSPHGSGSAGTSHSGDGITSSSCPDPYDLTVPSCTEPMPALVRKEPDNVASMKMEANNDNKDSFAKSAQLPQRGSFPNMFPIQTAVSTFSSFPQSYLSAPPVFSRPPWQNLGMPSTSLSPMPAAKYCATGSLTAADKSSDPMPMCVACGLLCPDYSQLHRHMKQYHDDLESSTSQGNGRAHSLQQPLNLCMKPMSSTQEHCSQVPAVNMETSPTPSSESHVTSQTQLSPTAGTRRERVVRRTSMGALHRTRRWRCWEQSRVTGLKHQCRVCGQSPRFSGSQERHKARESHHEEGARGSSVSPPNPAAVDRSSPGTLLCPLCPHMDTRGDQLLKHLVDFHQLTLPSSTSRPESPGNAADANCVEFELTEMDGGDAQMSEECKDGGTLACRRVTLPVREVVCKPILVRLNPLKTT